MAYQKQMTGWPDDCLALTCPYNMNKNNEKKHTMKFITTDRMIVATAAIALALSLPSAQAVNITISDTIGSSGTGQGGEVSETEPSTVNNHSWDLEAFAIKGNKLVLISGFNLLNGNSGFNSGDIFINTAGSLPIGQTGLLGSTDGNKPITGNMGYEYALDLDIAGGKFNVVNLTTGSGVNLLSGFYRQNDKSNPFQYVSGGTIDYADQSLTYMTYNTLLDLQAAYGNDITTSGAYNYAIELDMSWFTGSGLDTHFTVGCGNDVIVGQATGGFDRVPDTGSTAMMLGLGLVGLFVAGRRVAIKA